jgi:hypothetical protein
MRNFVKLIPIPIASLLLAGCLWVPSFVAKPLNGLGKDTYKWFLGRVGCPQSSLATL